MTDDVKWPGVLEYLAAVQNAPQSFRDPELRAARFETDGMGDVTTGQGQTATVFFADTPARKLAVRCFTREVRDAAERYQRLEEFLRQVPLPALARAEWLADGVTVDGRSWPVVKMEQVDGVGLGRYVEEHLRRPDLLLELAERWRRTAETLTDAGVAHGDLQQDNIIVTRDVGLRLIDLDSVWVPGMPQTPPDENGHRNFQHPERLATGLWHPRIDAFAALVIYLSLRSVAAQPALWEYHNDENLILVDTDFLQPGRSAIWGRLHASPDLEVRDLTQLLAGFCRTSARVLTDLGTVLGRMRVPDGPAWTPGPVAAEEIERWWEAGVEDDPDPDDPGSGTDVEATVDVTAHQPPRVSVPSRRRPPARAPRNRLWPVLAFVVILLIAVALGLAALQG